MISKTKSAITKILAAAGIGDRFRVVFKPATDKCWAQVDNDGVREFVDANQAAIYSGTLLHIVEGTPHDFTIDRTSGGDVRLNDVEDDYLWANASYIASIEPLPSPIKVQPDGLKETMILDPVTGECKVGCQTITRAGCEQAFRALGQHLGYEIEG